MSDADIRRVRADELPALVRALGQRGYFAERLDRQAAGRGILLAAWRDEGPIGDVYLHLEPAEEWQIRRWLPTVPLLTHLEVLPAHRDRGVGTLLIAATENTARGLGHDLIALAVEPRNSAAARLYRRLGYADWAHELVMCLAREETPDGLWVRRPEWCRVLVKPLREDVLDTERRQQLLTG